jgi:hypothetical protein
MTFASLSANSRTRKEMGVPPGSIKEHRLDLAWPVGEWRVLKGRYAWPS